MTSRQGALFRGLWRLVLATALVVLGLLGPASTPASAASRDSVDSWDFVLAVQPDGSMRVTETLVYRFGQNSGRHGIVRELVTREPWDDNQDAVFTISNVQVSSPNASSHVTVTRNVGTGRNRTDSLRIGSADRTVTAPTATYTISYVVRGALRSSPFSTPNGYAELYWDLLSGEAPDTRNISVQVTVPGGVKDVGCWSGAVKESVPCAKAEVAGGKGLYSVPHRPAGDILTVAAKIAQGAVTNPEPDLQPRAEASPTDYVPGPSAGLGAVATTSLAGLVGWSVIRRKGRDLRFLDVPPGVVPSGGGGRVGLSNNPEIPVAFSPPRISVAEAGLLVDGQVDVRETTATLVDLAVRGALQMEEGPSRGTLLVTLVDPGLVRAPHEAVLVDSLFSSGLRRRGLRPQTGQGVLLGRAGDMEQAHRELVASVTSQVAGRGWFTDVPRTRLMAGGGGTLGVFVFLWLMLSGGVLTWWPLLLAIAGPLLVAWLVSKRLRRGQRSAVGRALTDQIEGFEKYLTTAETEQLRFEEGEDIFSRYLPWAIIFGVAERWTKVCEPLIEAGQIPQPMWYHGSYMDWYVMNSILDSLNRTALPTPPPSTGGLSGTGFGSGSAFGGGGGFSGGGGGGGSVSSW